MDPFFRHRGFEFELKLLLGAASYRCAEAGEVLATTAGIADGDFDSWFDAWTAAGARLAETAARAEAARHRPRRLAARC